MNPLELAVSLGATFDELGVDYAIGGSVASSFFGEPRSTLDIDIALRANPATLRQMLKAVAADYYVPADLAEHAIAASDSFNLLHDETGTKIDLFILGDGLLDQLQIDRRIELSIGDGRVWVTSPADIVLRKLWWFRLTNETSERQWRDVVALLRTSSVDRAALLETADLVDLGDLARRAIIEAG